jgi:RimJ/RimL family protein N-acetyltransferase
VLRAYEERDIPAYANLASVAVARKLGFVETGYVEGRPKLAIVSRVRPSSESSVTSA